MFVGIGLRVESPEVQEPSNVIGDVERLEARWDNFVRDAFNNPNNHVPATVCFSSNYLQD
jgi:hypothetical protein